MAKEADKVQAYAKMASATKVNAMMFQNQERFQNKDRFQEKGGFYKLLGSWLDVVCVIMFRQHTLAS